MNKNDNKKSIQERRAFKIGNSFVCAVSIPDKSVGCSGSRCSNCNSPSSYCYQICRTCKMPFIGPFGFPQINTWKTMTLKERGMLAKKIFLEKERHGRLGYVNVAYIPLVRDEAKKILALDSRALNTFLRVHEIPSLQKFQELFL